jgi:hypothetical protein
MLKQAASDILNRYIKIAEMQIGYKSDDVVKVASVLIEDDIKRAELYDRVKQADAYGRSLAHTLVVNYKR